MRSRLTIGQPGDGTHQSLAIMAYTVRLGIEYHQQPVALAHGGSNAVLQTCVVLIRHYQLVYHYFHIVILIAVELHAGQSLAHLAIYADIEVALLAHLLEEFLIMTFTATHQRSKDINALAFIVVQNKVENLFFGILHHLFAGEIRIGLACTSIQQTEVIVHFRCSAYRRARILVRRLLLDGYYRAQPRYLVNIRTFQIAQEVAGIGRESLDIAALPLCKKSIECQRGFTAST